MHHWKPGQDGIGACGRIGPLLSPGFQILIVEFDAETESPVRNAKGFCTVVRPGKVGELISKIDQSLPLRRLVVINARYDGYLNRPLDDQKKVLRNVFKQGDAYFRTGDLFKQDALGRYYYFVDRVGDTVRCKGENISTVEVESHLNTFPGVKEVCVYGVSVDGYDGGFPMAALVVDGLFRVEGLIEFLGARLPGYSIPRFLRLVDKLDATGTFKFQKHILKARGIDVGGSIMYWWCVGDPAYSVFKDKQRKELKTGEPRL